LIKFLSKLFIKDSENVTSPAVRQAYGVLSGCLGIALNILLFGGKFIVGFISGSIAVMADAFNNLSDAGSSIVTLIGFKLSNQKPDLHHPFGHGRIEYVSGFIVSMIIILMGFELGKSSIQKILSPEKVQFSIVTVIILIAAILVKLYMALCNRYIGRKISSPTIYAAATDSISDCVSTTVVLLSMLISYFTSINVDGICGIAVALFILYSGLRSAKDTLDPLLGQPPEKEQVDRIKAIVMSYDEVMGIHDLIIHDYGPGRSMISLHAEVSSDGDLLHIHDTIDNIEQKLALELSCDAVIHMDPIVVNDDHVSDIHEKVTIAVKNIDANATIHDFRVVEGVTHTNLIFDVVIPYSVKLSDSEILSEVAILVKDIDASYRTVVKIDRSYV